MWWNGELSVGREGVHDYDEELVLDEHDYGEMGYDKVHQSIIITLQRRFRRIVTMSVMIHAKNSMQLLVTITAEDDGSHFTTITFVQPRLDAPIHAGAGLPSREVGP